MEALTYKKLKHTEIVYLAGSRVGIIKKVKNGFQYFPNNCKDGGIIYITVAQVKRSLEVG